MAFVEEASPSGLASWKIEFFLRPIVFPEFYQKANPLPNREFWVGTREFDLPFFYRDHRLPIVNLILKDFLKDGC